MNLTRTTLTPRLAAALGLAALAGALQAANYPDVVVSQNPAAYWRLNETVAPPPVSPAANLGSLGTAGNGQYLVEPLRGEPGVLAGDTSVRFSNPTFDAAYGGSKIEVAYDPALNPKGPFSVELWAKPTASVPSGTGSICAMATMESSGTARAGWLIYQTSANKWQFRLGDMSGYRDGGAVVGGLVTPGAWHHVVAVYDGGTATLYVNGALAASGAIANYETNAAKPFRIGTSSFTGSLGTYMGNRGFDGWLDEVAFYSKALSAAAVKVHYDAAASPAVYPATVLADQPVGYWRLSEAGDPPAANLGSLGAAANGRYVASAKPGEIGPRPAAQPGFAADNFGVGFDGAAGSVTAPALKLNTAQATITAWIKPSGVQAANAVIAACGANGATGLKFDVTDANGLSYNWDNLNGAFNFKSGLAVPADQWSFVAMIVRPDQATLVLHDGTDFRTADNFLAHPTNTFNTAFRIGTGTASTNTFNGTIDEVAVWSRALSLGEVYSQWAEAVGGQKPVIFVQPQAPVGTVYAGDTLVLSVDAGGTAALKYQWRKGTTNIPDATGSVLTKPGLTTADSGDYNVVVSNGSGSATSAAVTIVVEALNSPVVNDPVGRTLYVGGSLTLKVDASGGALQYQWKRSGTAIPNATNSTYVISSATGADTGDYTVVVSNRLGSVESGSATVTVVVPAAGSFEAYVVADAPEAWWRFEEDAGAPGFMDAMGRHDGLWMGTVTTAVPGLNNSKAVSLDGLAGDSYGEVPFSPALNGQNFSIEVWAKSTDVANDLCPAASFGAKRGYFFQKRAAGTWWGCAGHNDQYSYYYSDMGPVVPGKWTQMVCTYDSSGLKYYLDGRLAAGPFGDFVRNVAEPFRIGLNKDLSFKWVGEVDEVAVYTRALTAQQVSDHYVSGAYGGGSKPSFVTQPKGGKGTEGGSFAFTTKVEGSLPIALQWTKNGANILNATNESLTVSPLKYSDNATYQLVASNSVGVTSSDAVILQVIPPPSFCNLTNDLVLHLAFEDNYNDASGRGNNGTPVGAPTFVAGKIGSKALHYSTTVASGSVTEANYVTLGTPADLMFGDSVNFTVSYWVRFTGAPGDLPFLCSAINSYGNQGLTFAPSYQAGGWSWSLGRSGAYIGIYGAAGSLNNGNWHNVVSTFNRAGNAVTYLDGAQVDSRLASGAGDIDSGNAVCIGQDPTGGYPEAGWADLDDLAVWRRALSAEEAQCIYTVGSSAGRSFDSYGPVTLLLRRAGANLELIWQLGTLVEADSLNGPWTPVGGAAAPYYLATPTAASKFFRVKY